MINHPVFSTVGVIGVHVCFRSYRNIQTVVKSHGKLLHDYEASQANGVGTRGLININHIVHE